MSILEGVKASTCRTEKPRFVIKPRHPSRENRDEPPSDPIATDADVTQLIDYIIAKSARLRELLEKRAIFNEEAFYERHLHSSVCLKTLLKQILDRMMTDRRLGKGLKGMNKSNLTEIENGVWNTVEREASLYQNDLDYARHKQQLSADLRRRREEVLGRLQRLGSGEEKAGEEERAQNITEAAPQE